MRVLASWRQNSENMPVLIVRDIFDINYLIISLLGDYKEKEPDYWGPFTNKVDMNNNVKYVLLNIAKTLRQDLSRSWIQFKVILWIRPASEMKW